MEEKRRLPSPLNNFNDVLAVVSFKNLPKNSVRSNFLEFETLYFGDDGLRRGEFKETVKLSRNHPLLVSFNRCHR